MAINPQKLLPPAKIGSSIVKAPQSIVKKPNAPSFGSSTLTDNITIIKTKVIQIEDILKGTLASEKKALDQRKRQESSKRREEQEEKLEKKPNAEKGKIKMPSAPKMGIFGWIKNFIGNIILGYFAVRLIDHLPKIIPIVKFLGTAADFVINVGGNLLNGLVTFIDFGYKAYDATRGFIKNLGGENFAQGFDKFVSAIDTTLFLTTIIATDLLAEALSGDGGGGLGDLVGDQLKRRGAQQAATTATGQAGGTVAKAGGIGAGTVAAVVAGAGLLSSALGEGSFQVKKVSQGFEKTVDEWGNASKKDKNPITRAMKMATWGMFGPMLRFGNWLLNGIGVTLDIIGAPFRYAIELLRYPFLSEEDKIKQANNLAKFDARIRDGIREHFAGFLSPLLRLVGKKDWADGLDKKGSMGSLFGERGTKGMGYRSGGITRGGKTQGGVRRTVSKQKYKRVVKKVPREPGKVEIKSDTDVGQKEKVFDFFGFIKNQVDKINPFNTIKKSGEELGKTDYFGPILAITSKITLGQKPTQQDYQNVGLGINMLIAKGIQDKQLKGGVIAAFAEGGFVDPDVLSAAETGGDISNWVAKTFKGEIESNAQKTLRMIRENAQKKKEGEDSEATGPRGSGEPEGLETAGGAVAASELYKEIGANAEQWDIFRNSIALIESGGKYGVPGGSGKHYDGRYQMGKAAKTDGSRVAGVPNPGHSDDPNAHVRVSFRNNPQLQETIFTGFTIANHRYLMRNPKYKSASVERKLEILGYAHNQGMGGAENWMNTGKVGADGFGTKGTKYTDLIAKNFRAKKSGGKMELAQGAVGVPSHPGLEPEIKGSVGSFGVMDPTPRSKPGVRGSSGYAADSGLDIIGKTGDPIVSPVSGKLLYAEEGHTSWRDDSNPNKSGHQPQHSFLIQLSKPFSYAGKNIKYAYGTHLSSLSKSVANKSGIQMRVGQTIGTMGVANKVPHLHLGLLQNRAQSSESDWLSNTQVKKVLTGASAFHGENFGIVPKDGFMLKLHKGEMFKVIDKDSVDLLGFDLSKEIIDIENKAQLVERAPSIIEKLKAISGYASYEEGSQETIVIPTPTPSVQDEYESSSSSGGVAFVPIGGGSDPFETLYQGG